MLMACGVILMYKIAEISGLSGFILGSFNFLGNYGIKSSYT